MKAIPATFLVDRNGQIVAQWTGNKTRWNEIEKAVEVVLNQHPVGASN